MKHVGMYALLLQNGMAKQTWKQYGFMKADEQINLIFAVMLYIMEQSLREESCTMDDIGAYIDNLNAGYLYKVEAQREYPITWVQAARNSGGEGFLTAFVILSSLMYYMRRDETDIFADRNEGKVLVMDNPFAQTNAEHLLKPLMDMAEKMNTQLICLSGLGGESIYGRFDNIYVLNLVSSNLHGGMQYLRGEHLRVAQEETIVSSRIEVIGQERLVVTV